MDEVYQVLRTVPIAELGCNPCDKTSFKKDYKDIELTDKHAIITAVDDNGYDQGDYDSIDKMHKLILQDNSLYKIVKWTPHIENVEGKHPNMYYTYLVTTDDVEYLSAVINLIHKQSLLDQAQRDFDKKYK